MRPYHHAMEQLLNRGSALVQLTRIALEVPGSLLCACPLIWCAPSHDRPGSRRSGLGSMYASRIALHRGRSPLKSMSTVL